MGVAAYNRGTKLVSRELDRTMRPHEFEVMDSLNSVRRSEEQLRLIPWGPIQYVEGNGGWWAEDPVKRSGYWFKNLRDAVRAFNVTVIGVDSTGWHAIPNTVRQ